MCTDGLGNLYIAYADLVVTKSDANGNQVWSFSNTYYDVAGDMIYVNGYVVVTQNTAIVKFNAANGAISSAAGNPSNTSIRCNTLAAGKDGCFYVSLSSGDIVKFDTSLNRLWTIHPTNSSNGIRMFVDNSNNLCLTVYGSGGAYKYDSNGNLIWSKNIGSGDLKFIDKNNYWYVEGHNKSSIAQFAPNGDRTWMFNENCVDGFFNPIYVDNDLNIYYVVGPLCKMRPEYTIVS
ncbi:hypothetical protein [Clostridium beijerinckii]|nr:hypothetical protein [Clostridium beijerinckii]